VFINPGLGSLEVIRRIVRLETGWNGKTTENDHDKIQNATLHRSAPFTDGYDDWPTTLFCVLPVLGASAVEVGKVGPG